MFIARSAFWLGLAVTVMHVNGWASGTDARAAGEQALRAGQDTLTRKISEVECTTFECAGGKALLVAAGSRLASQHMQAPEAQPAITAPIPRPRLERTST